MAFRPCYIRWMFWVAVSFSLFVLVIRPILFSILLGDSFHRQMSEEMDAPLLLTVKATKDQVNLLQSNESESNTTDVMEAATKLGPIFYNVYVPEERSNDTLQIIEEQIRFRNDTDPDAPILYTLIGSRKVKGSIQRMCQPNCTRRKYLQEGNEIDTLQALWEYCQDNPSDIVTYIHDKGSFHPSDANHNARGVGTKAALQCRRLMMNQHTDVDPINDRTLSNTTDKTKIAKSTCSICSYRFYAFPIYHARANMWTAECSYIRDLLPPRQYESTVLDMYRETVNHTILGATKYACIRPYDQSDRFLGLDRYAMERWALNHPNVQPCDSQTKEEIRNLKRDRKSATEFTPRLVPAPQKRAKISGITSFVTSWQRLVGRLFEWKYLYGKKPPESSWVWKYYRGHEQGTKEFLNACTTIKEETIFNLSALNTTINGRPLRELLADDE